MVSNKEDLKIVEYISPKQLENFRKVRGGCFDNKESLTAIW